MILTDYFRSTPDLQWTLAKQLGVNHAVVRLPEDDDFDITDTMHIKRVADTFRREGLTPLVVEPMPNSVHDSIKRGDKNRDSSIEKVIKMLPLLSENGFTTICMNFMAEIGWLRTTTSLMERGGALVTGFDLRKASVAPTLSISAKALWENLAYFLKAVVPYAEKYGMRLAIHPDDPPIAQIGGVSRILTSLENIQRAIDIVKSDCVGITMCQANFAAMGEDVYASIRHFGAQNKIFFVHFRDIVGTRECFHEAFHDNGMTDMARAVRAYRDCGFTGPVRIDHVPTMAGEENARPGYETIGRLYAIGYLRGLCEASNYPLQ